LKQSCKITYQSINKSITHPTTYSTVPNYLSIRIKLISKKAAGTIGVITETICLIVLYHIILFQIMNHLQEPECDCKYPGFRTLEERKAG
jgi:hypothetical protein